MASASVESAIDNAALALRAPNALDYNALTGRLVQVQRIAPTPQRGRAASNGKSGLTTQGVLLALAMVAFAVVIVYGLVRRNRAGSGRMHADGDSPSTVAQWTEGETTRLLSSAELPGLYLLRPRFLTKAESVVYLLLKAAFPRHEIFARIRLADVLQVKIGPQGMERLRAFRKIANQHVGFVVCDRDMTIVAIVDAKEPDQVINPRDQKLEVIKQRCLQAAQVKYLCVYPPQMPRYRELREQILGPAADLV